MAWVSEQLLTHEDWRRDLPLLAAPDVQAGAVDGMRKRLAELLDDPELLARHRTAMDGQAIGRMLPSLPYIDTVPVDGGLRVRLTTARAVLDVAEDTVTLSAAGNTFEFAPETEASGGGRPVRHDAHIYEERNTVQRCINKLKAWRGIATRYDKTPDSYLAGLNLRASMIWIKDLAPGRSMNHDSAVTPPVTTERSTSARRCVGRGPPEVRQPPCPPRPWRRSPSPG